MLRVHLSFAGLALALALGLMGCGSSSPAPDAGKTGTGAGADGDAKHGPTTFLKADCLTLAAAWEPSAAPFCEQLFTALNPDPPFTREQCIEQGSALDPERAEGFCNFIYPAAGYSSDSPIIGPNQYVAMPDGTLIATNIKLPKNYQAGRKYPVVIEMSGYESGSDDGATVSGDFAAMTGLPTPLQGGTRAAHGKYYEDSYVSITASVRGTGCSSGEFDLFSEISALDGYHLVEWAAAQPWSNGDVGLFGHSYSGITATLIAATQPPHLRVISVSGLIGDLYRDIVYPGGLTNYGFPLLWTGGVRLAYDLLGGTLAGLAADGGNRQCLRNQGARSRTALNDPILHGLQDWDSQWYRSRSVAFRADRIQVPTQVLIGYQDEQTGPRGAYNVYDHLSPAIPKRLVMLNGDHDAQAQLPETIAERQAWLDYWLLGKPDPFVDPRKRNESVRVLLEISKKHPGDATERSNGEVESDGFPLSQTRWTDFYLQPGGGLSTARPGADGGYTTYFHGSHRQFYGYTTMQGVDNGGELTSVNGPDEALFRTEPFAEPLVVAGPITATLHMQAQPAELPVGVPLPTDLELMVQVLDEGPAGELTYLQRGVLRAAHREIDPLLSQYTDEGRIYRPFRPHNGPVPDLLLADEAYELLVEVFPVGHVFRPGHRLAVKVHAPALDDNDWIYIPKSTPAIASLHHSAQRPSSLMLPVIPLAAVERLGPDLGPCASSRVRCVTPVF